MIFRYNCSFPNKMIVLQSDLDNNEDDSVTEVLSITCQDNGTYDKNIEDYACTKVCPPPSNPDPDFMEISHNITSDPKPEIYQTVT